MNSGEFHALKARFGDDVANWPAPYRQEAQHLLAAGRTSTTTEDARLDRLVLAATSTPTDEAMLARAVMARIAGTTPRSFARAAWRTWSPAAIAASLALVLIVAAVGGVVAGGADARRADTALLALAVGMPVSALGDMGAMIQGRGGPL